MHGKWQRTWEVVRHPEVDRVRLTLRRLLVRRKLGQRTKSVEVKVVDGLNGEVVSVEKVALPVSDGWMDGGEVGSGEVRLC